MLLVVMILGVLLIQKVPEKWFRFLFLACILLNVIYRIEFLPFALAGGVRLVCKGMELVLLIVACKVFDKRPVYLSIGVLSLLFFCLLRAAKKHGKRQKGGRPYRRPPVLYR